MKIFRNKRGQITIFIIVALVIVALIVVFFALSKTGIIKIPAIFPGQDTDLKSQFIKCVEDNKNIDNSVKLISSQGGSLNPSNYILYDSVKVEYLCYINEYYKPCVMQKPLILNNAESEIRKASIEEISKCMETVKKNIEAQGNVVSLGKMELNVSIIPENIIYSVKYPVTIQKNENQQKYDIFEIRKPSELYQMIMVSTSILNYEARYGEADILTYMTYYPTIRVNREKMDDGSTVYFLSERNTKEVFMFAVRSYAWPAGYSG